MRREWAAVGIAVLSLAWAMWVPLSAALAAADPSVGLTVGIAATYRAAALVCHQQPARSFFVGNVQQPVCARCVGLYAGAAAGSFAGLWWFRRSRGRTADAGRRLSRARTLVLAAGAPTAVLWMAEHAASLDVGNALRCAGALPLGAAVAAVVVAWAAGVPFDDSAPALR